MYRRILVHLQNIIFFISFNVSFFNYFGFFNLSNSKIASFTIQNEIIIDLQLPSEHFNLKKIHETDLKVIYE